MSLDVTEFWTGYRTGKGVGFFKEADEWIFCGTKHRKWGPLAHWYVHGTRLGNAFSGYLGTPKPKIFPPTPNTVGPPGDTMSSK